MGSLSRTDWRWGVATLLLLFGSVAVVRADVTIERGASIIIFPKVLSDSHGFQTGGRPIDTIIQISNKSNSLVFAHCFYVNATPLDPTTPPSAANPAQWQEVDFDIVLTKQQPTHWVASTGRRIDPTTQNQVCNASNPDCPNAGLGPGLIPPVSDPFSGELKCIEVDSTGAPLNGNHLKGEATLLTTDDKDVSKYNAIGIIGLNTDSGPNNGDNVLCLGGSVSSLCPTGAEYNACPETVIMDHFAEHASDPVLQEFGVSASAVRTQLTLVPCTEDFETQAMTAVTVQFLVINEFEQPFSTSTTVSCWGNLFLDDISRIFDVSVLGTRFAQTRMSAPDTDLSNNPMSGFVGVAEEFHDDGSNHVGRAAVNLHGEGVRLNSDLITLPELQ